MRRAERILAVAHRGDSAERPENTAAAFDAAVAAGVDAIELDLRPTADGIVVCHDHSLARFRGGRRPLRRRRLDELREVDVGSWFDRRFAGERLLTLDELLRRYSAKVELLLELKAAGGLFAGRLNHRLCRETVEAVRRARALDRVYILCFSAAVLAEVARLEPRLRLVRNCSFPPRRLEPWLRRQPRLHAVDFDRRRLSDRLVTACHAAGLRVFCWSSNDAAAADRAAATGVDGILSDRPEWLVGHLRRRGAR
jgi:glycerophosphoryl diester phosphodiesterase